MLELPEETKKDIERAGAMLRLLVTYIDGDYDIAKDLLKADGVSEEDVEIIITKLTNIESLNK